MAGIADIASTAGLDPVSCPHCGRRIRTGAKVFENLFRAILRHVREGGDVQVRGFGIFRRFVYPARTHAEGVTRRMGNKVYDASGEKSAPVLRISFKPSKRAKAFLNKKEGEQ